MWYLWGSQATFFLKLLLILCFLCRFLSCGILFCGVHYLLLAFIFLPFLNTSKSSRNVIFNDWNQKSRFSVLTNCIKSIHRNNFLLVYINYSYKFCDVLFFSVLIGIMSWLLRFFWSMYLCNCVISGYYSIAIKTNLSRNPSLLHSALRRWLMWVNFGRAVACHC